MQSQLCFGVATCIPCASSCNWQERGKEKKISKNNSFSRFSTKGSRNNWEVKMFPSGNLYILRIKIMQNDIVIGHVKFHLKNNEGTTNILCIL